MRFHVVLGVTFLVLAAPAAATGQEAVLRAEDCRRAVAHVPAPDVAYRPGVDAYGRSVAPADLDGGGSGVQTPERVVIALGIPLADLLGGAVPPRLGAADVEIGRVVFEGGRLTYNGQPLSDPAAQVVVERCRRLLDEGR